MKARAESLHTTFAMLGKTGSLDFDVEIEAFVYPAEPMVRYYQDGSGYPGAPAYAEITRVIVWAIYGAFGVVKRDPAHAEWFALADQVANNFVSEGRERYENRILENCDGEE